MTFGKDIQFALRGVLQQPGYTAVAALSKKIDELEQARRSFEAKLDAMEKRLREPPAKGASKTRPAKSKPRPAKARPRR